MEGFFQKIGIYAHEGQKYEPEDSAQLSSYREDKSGQVLEEGINEAGAMSSWIAAATSYTNHDVEMIPIYIFYSIGIEDIWHGLVVIITSLAGILVFTSATLNA